MDRYEISGGRRLTGEIYVQGAKNSVLPILAATVLTADRCVIHNCPALSDTALTIRILRTLGCRADWRQGNIFVDSSDLSHLEISGSLTGKMRSSIVFLGPLLARCGQAIIAYPGGCRLGPRPIDLHLDGLRQMGATVQEEEQYLRCCAPEGLQGARIVLSFPSVGATENLMMAAVLAKGKTTLINCACEPEIVDLADFLIRCGAKIRGAGENTVEIEGVSRLHGCEHVVIGDRIAAATYLVAAAMTGGEVVVIRVFRRMVCRSFYRWLQWPEEPVFLWRIFLKIGIVVSRVCREWALPFGRRERSLWWRAAAYYMGQMSVQRICAAVRVWYWRRWQPREPAVLKELNGLNGDTNISAKI